MITRRSILASAAAIAVTPARAAAAMPPIVFTGDMGTTGTALRAIWKNRDVLGIDIQRGPEQDILGDKWKAALQPGCTVVHMAIKRGWEWEPAEYCHQLNSAVLKACIDAKVGRLVFTSSQMIYARELQFGSLTYYAAEKLSMEARLRAAAEQGSLQARIMRLGHFNPKAADFPHDWTRLNEATLAYWFDLAVDPASQSPIETWSVIGRTSPIR